MKEFCVAHAVLSDLSRSDHIDQFDREQRQLLSIDLSTMMKKLILTYSVSKMKQR